MSLCGARIEAIELPSWPVSPVISSRLSFNMLFPRSLVL
jgi:hypothetical protein